MTEATAVSTQSSVKGIRSATLTIEYDDGKRKEYPLHLEDRKSHKECADYGKHHKRRDESGDADGCIKVNGVWVCLNPE